MLQQAAALRAAGHLIPLQELLDPRIRLKFAVAVQTAHPAGRAVQFDDVPAARLLVQAVDILRDQGPQPTGALPAGQQTMADIRLATGQVAMRDGLLPPVLIPGRRRGEKLFVVDRLRRGPDSTRRTKVRYATLGAHTGPGERHRPMLRDQPTGNLLALSIVRRLAVAARF